ncbi:hypothetical protein, partial [Romboutsia sp. 13368]|uniref:hypothetical protein n=1 Tax=Romboutsia sp. 13368 TaxID=2708053 RepID=UPI002ED12D5F
ELKYKKCHMEFDEKLASLKKKKEKQKEKENKNKKENKELGEKSNGNDIKTSRKFKHTSLYETEDEYIYKKPSEEQLRYAREL